MSVRCSALLLASTILLPTGAFAQDAPTSTEAQIDALKTEIEALKAEVQQLKAASAKTTPSWKGAPELASKEQGWSFKPRGRLQYDFANVDGPSGYDNPGLGFSNELRRGRLGAEGTIPGGFGYKFELEFAEGEAEFTDAFLDYKTGAWTFTVGQHNNFQSLDELTSSLHSSFIERAAFTDAFGFERRVGASVQFASGDLLAQGGVFTDNIGDLNDIGASNNAYSLDGRLVFAPKLGENQLHFGASAHWRELNDSATTLRYRQRPAVHTTDVRFIDTGTITFTEKERGYGLESAGIFGPFHIAGEAYWQTVSRSGQPDPTFFGAYLEAGYFLTGESRGYKAGKFDRVKVKNGFDKDGFGAIGLNIRWDYLDLISKNIGGGKQNAYQASLNWKPSDYVLFGLNYAHLVYDDAAIAVDGDRDYSVDMVGLRSQIDF